MATIRPRGGGCCPSRPKGAAAPDRTLLSTDQVPIEHVGDHCWALSFDEVGARFKQLSAEQQRAVLTELRSLTQEQAAAVACAASHIDAVAATMAEVTDEERLPAMHPELPKAMWDILNGKLVEQLLEHTPLVDLDYLVTLVTQGGVLPAGRQNVPPAAFITQDNVWTLEAQTLQQGAGQRALSLLI